MIKSPLATLSVPSPCFEPGRYGSIEFITPHCTTFPCTAREPGEYFLDRERNCSSNYGIGSDGEIALFVSEDDRSFCSSSPANDSVDVTIECASAETHPHEMTEAVRRSLILLCTDICRRYGKKRLLWIEDRAAAFRYVPRKDELMLTVHRRFDKGKECPGDRLYARLGTLAETVTAALTA